MGDSTVYYWITQERLLKNYKKYIPYAHNSNDNNDNNTRVYRSPDKLKTKINAWLKPH